MTFYNSDSDYNQLVVAWPAWLLWLHGCILLNGGEMRPRNMSMYVKYHVSCIETI